MQFAEFIRVFLVYSQWSLEALLLPPTLIATIVLTGSLVAAFPSQKPSHDGLWRHHYWVVFSQLIFFPVVIVIGVLFRVVDPGPPYHANVMGERLLDLCFLLSLATGCFWIYRMKRLRWLAASLVLLQEIPLLCAAFIAGMSVSGDWI